MAEDVIESNVNLSAASGVNIAATPDMIVAFHTSGGTNYDLISTTSKTVVSTGYSGGSIAGLASNGSNVYWGIYSGSYGWLRTNSSGVAASGAVAADYSPRPGAYPNTGVFAGGYFYARTYLENGWLTRLSVDGSGGLNALAGSYSAVAPVSVMHAGITAETANTIYGASGNIVKVINASTGSLTRSITVNGNLGAVGAVAPSSNGNIWAVGASSSGAEVWMQAFRESDGATVVPAFNANSVWGQNFYGENIIFAKSIGTKLYVGISNFYYGTTPHNIMVFDTKTNTYVKKINLTERGLNIAFYGSKAAVIQTSKVSIFDTGQGVTSSGFFSMF